ncbi:hypothetical protein GGE12_004454 [Rhizobium mongolense]|uniref:Uncharacterized protein n=1 Tax=Rhizobium mongolense TaxID=57676 RepID=A0A7W6RQB2_9HYPH|nr:hypothetical protein [Rhizobium mongolense]
MNAPTRSNRVKPTLRVSALPWVAFHYYLSAQDKTPLPYLRLPRGTPG